MEAPTGYEGLTTFDYTFSTDHTAESFKGGVMKIVYEFEVSDNSEETQLTSKDYIFFVIDTYSVTFVVKDAQGNEVNDAKVVLGENELTAAPYVFDFVPKGDYDYTISKAGYQTVTGSFEMGEEDQVINITLVSDLSDWSADIPLALQGQTTWASYNGVAVTEYKNETIGFAFTYTDGNTVRVTKTDNAAGWVLVDAEPASKEALVDAYANGTVISQYNLPYDQHKAYANRYFVSKVGNDYLLVKYVAGHRDENTGNIVVFKYKN